LARNRADSNAALLTIADAATIRDYMVRHAVVREPVSGRKPEAFPFMG
jgi:hypothetical protein